MIQFLSKFFFYFFNFCWGFQKFPFFCVTLYLSNHSSIPKTISRNDQENLIKICVQGSTLKADKELDPYL